MAITLHIFMMITSYGLIGCEFTSHPPDGNWLEFSPLILQWPNTFDNIRGCMWMCAKDDRSPYLPIIQYGTHEGTEVKQIGWELTNINNPCSGGIQKRNSSKFDEGVYEFRIVAGGQVIPSDNVIVTIIKPTDRSIDVTSHKETIILLPEQNINRIVVVENFINVSIRLNDIYPNSTCINIRMFRLENLSRVMDVCVKTFDFDTVPDDDSTHSNISVNLDIVNFTSFEFSILLKAKDTKEDTHSASSTTVSQALDGHSSSSRMSNTALISTITVVALGVVLIGVGVVVYLIVKMKRNIESHQSTSTSMMGEPMILTKNEGNHKVEEEMVQRLNKHMKPKWTRHFTLLDFGIIACGDVILCPPSKLVMLKANGKVEDMQITPDVSYVTNIAVNNQTGEIVVGGTSRNLSEELCIYRHENNEWELQNRIDLEQSAVNCVKWTMTNDILVSETGIWQTRDRSNLSRYTTKGETIWRREIAHVVTDIMVDNKDNIYCCCAGKRGFYVFNADGLSRSVIILDVTQSIYHLPVSFCFDSKERVVVLLWDIMRKTGVLNLFDKNGMFIKNVGKVNSIDTFRSKIRFWNDSTMYVSNMKGIMAFDVNLEKKK